jgi:hypothetical protein
MDKSENLAESYLQTCGFTSVVYEPDGNIPPDFLCDGQVAVEVRRLNQNYDAGSGMKGLEEAGIPLSKHIRKLLLSFGAPTQSQSWYVYYRFSRPVPAWKTLKPLIANELKAIASVPQSGFDKRLCSGFNMKIFPASAAKKDLFVLAGSADQQSGGCLINEMQQNLSHCINDKIQKITPYRARYPSWWLLLPDYIGFGLDDLDRRDFQKTFAPTHIFQKIVLLDPTGLQPAFVI